MLPYPRSTKAAEEDWSSHAPLCKLLVKLVAVAGGKNPLDKNPGACLQLAGIAKMCLRRNLTQFESDILMYPRLVLSWLSFSPQVHKLCLPEKSKTNRQKMSKTGQNDIFMIFARFRLFLEKLSADVDNIW